MKKLIFLILVAIAFVGVRHKTADKKREQLVGKWMMEQNFPGVVARMHINLKPSGDFYVVVDAAGGGQTAFGESTGKWKTNGSVLQMDFTKNGMPGIDPSQHYGGSILTLDDKTLSYKSKEGVETWRRVR